MSLKEAVAHAVEAAKRLWLWLRQGYGAVTPDRWRAQFPWRPHGIAVDATSPLQQRLYESNFFGDIRLSANEAAGGDLSSTPLNIAIARSDIFRTQLELPRAARGRLHRAIALRLDQISPIPPADAVVAHRVLSLTSNKRLVLDVAITRRATIETMQRQYGDADRDVSIGADFDDAGALRLVFVIHKASPRPIKVRLTPRSALVAALLALVVALPYRQSTRIDALDAHRAELLSELRFARTELTQLEETHAAFIAAREAPSAATFLQTLDRFASTAPEMTRFSTASLNRSGVVITGYTGSTQTEIEALLAPFASASETPASAGEFAADQSYEAINRFSITINHGSGAP